jgi:PAS domain-containing protein
MYHRKPARPLPAELRLVEAGARLAGNVITRLRSEKRLRDTSNRLDLAEKAAEFGIWEVNVASGDVAVSRGFAALIGLPAALRTFSLLELDSMLHPDDRAAVRASAEEAIKTGNFEAEFRIIPPDGSIRWERSQGRVELVEGESRTATGALIDITDERICWCRSKRFARLPKRPPVSRGKPRTSSRTGRSFSSRSQRTGRSTRSLWP